MSSHLPQVLTLVSAQIKDTKDTTEEQTDKVKKTREKCRLTSKGKAATWCVGRDVQGGRVAGSRGHGTA